MKKRLFSGLLIAGLMAAMLPGVATAGKDQVVATSGRCVSNGTTSGSDYAAKTYVPGAIITVGGSDTLHFPGLENDRNPFHYLPGFHCPVGS